MNRKNIRGFFQYYPSLFSFLASKARSLNHSTNEKNTDMGKMMRFSLKLKLCKGCKWIRNTDYYSGLEKFLLSLALKVCEWIILLSIRSSRSKHNLQYLTPAATKVQVLS